MSSTAARQFNRDAERLTHDLRHRGFIQTSLKKWEVARDAQRSKYQDWQAARRSAAGIKWESVNHLDSYLVEFADRAAARGTKIHWARNAAEAREIILEIVKAKKARSIIKSKVMTGEEIHLNEALIAAGYDVVESDLGEFIVQLRHETPYHFVFPAMHLTRGEISALFERELGSAPTSDPQELTMIARKVMREKYVTADIGISGANFAIAETGMISITENEGNARLSCGLPKVHIALMGIEKVLPRFEDLALFLPMLATAGTGQALTGYNSMYAGPRQPGEPDGPEEFHVVLLDNKRTQLLADPEQRDALHCIRCGACLNVCPIYKNIGGHSYGSTYQGPIGSVITPHLSGLQDWKHLSNASSLCGACTEVCPVRINLHHHLLHNRRNAVQAKPIWWEKKAFQIFAIVMNWFALYRLATRLAWLAQPFHALVKGTILDPALSWTKTRELPPLQDRSFKQYWKERQARK
jgi:L-lactate dehydrogenase complex protein LldF